MLPELEFVSWQRFHQDSFELAKLLSSKRFETIVSVSRGGHVLSRVLSDFLSLPIFNVSMKAYKDFDHQEVSLTQKLGQYLANQRVLLVDEIVDTGNTLARALKYIQRLRTREVFSVALYCKPSARPRPNLFHNATKKWVVFPYEVHETIKTLLPMWEKAGKPVEHLRQKLIEGGIKSTYVDFFLVEAVKKSTKRP